MSSALDDFLRRMADAMPRNPIGNKQARRALQQARQVNRQTQQLLKKFDQKLAMVERKLAAQAKAGRTASRRRRGR